MTATNAAMKGPVLAPASVSEVVDLVRSGQRILPVGSGSKPATSRPPEGFTAATLRGLAGFVDYDPAELTFTALAGTPLEVISAELARHGQYLPFDPPFSAQGATLGGTIAAGLSGAGRHRFGGIRDFILGVRIVTGLGEQVRGGGRVVKNAAGFDLPKLFVGSLGRLGVLVEATFKVFPRPREFGTLLFGYDGLPGAFMLMDRLKAGAFDLEALEILPESAQVAVRFGGLAEAMQARLAAAETAAGSAAERLLGDAEARFWRGIAPAAPADPQSLLVKVPLTVGQVPELEAFLSGERVRRRYSAACNVAWVEWRKDAASLDAALRKRQLSALALFGSVPGPLIGRPGAESFRARVKGALDPEGRFPGF